MIAEGFVDAGASVYIASRKADVVKEVAKELSKKGTCVGIPADLSKEEGCRALADDIASRVDRLDIVMPVKEERRRPRCAEPVAVHDRVPRRLGEMHVLESDPTHFVRTPDRAAPDVFPVVRQRTDARDREQALEFFDIPLAA